MSPDASWNFGPGPIVLIGALLVIYVPRWWTVRREDPRHAPVWRLVAYLLGVTSLLAAQLSPIDSLGEQIFVMHMVQHLLLLDVMPILLLFGLNRVILRPVTRRVQRLERRAGFLAHPVFAVVLYIGGMWFWHIPTMYDAAVRYDSVHLLEHMTFTNIGMLYWWHLMRPIPGRHRFGGMQPVAYMLVTKVGVGILGIIITFATVPIYDFYANQPEFWGLDPIADQTSAGALMAIEQSFIMGIALALLMFRGLAESERTQVRAERREDAAAAALAESGPADDAEAGQEREDAAAVAERRDPYSGADAVGGGGRR